MKLLRKRYIVAIGGLSALLVTLSYTFYFNGSPEVRGNQIHRAVKESSLAKSTFDSEQPAKRKKFRISQNIFLPKL